MGVEPTAACSAQPATGFEDQGTHRDTTTPVLDIQTLPSGLVISLPSLPYLTIPVKGLTASFPLDRIPKPLTKCLGLCLAGIAQLVEHCTENAGVPSSSLGPGTSLRIFQGN